MKCAIKQNMYWLVVVQWGTTIGRLNEMVGYTTPPSQKNKVSHKILCCLLLVFFL